MPEETTTCTSCSENINESAALMTAFGPSCDPCFSDLEARPVLKTPAFWTLFPVLTASVLFSPLGLFVGARALSKPRLLEQRLLTRAEQLSWKKVSVGSAVLATIAALCIFPIIGIPLETLFEFDASILAVMDAAFKNSSPLLFGVLTVLAVVAAVGEELLFRGAVQTRLTERWGAWPAILVSAGLFGLAHLDWIQGGFALLFGIFLGWTVKRSGSIVPALVAHSVNNLLACLGARYWSSEMDYSVGLDDWIALAVALFIAVPTVALLLHLWPEQTGNDSHGASSEPVPPRLAA